MQVVAIQRHFQERQGPSQMVVEIVGDSAGHLADCPEPLGLDDLLLVGPQIAIRQPQFLVQLRIGQGDGKVIGQGLQKIALIGGEGIWAVARGDDRPQQPLLGPHGDQAGRMIVKQRRPFAGLRGLRRHVGDINQLVPGEAIQCVLKVQRRRTGRRAIPPSPLSGRGAGGEGGGV